MSKNHWIEQHRLKNSKFWTIAFQKNGFTFFQPRRVSVSNNPRGLGSNDGEYVVTFENAMVNTSDVQLSGLFTKARASMNDWIAIASLYQSMSELQYCKIEHLKFKHIRVGKKVADMDFCFEYKNNTVFYCA